MTETIEKIPISYYNYFEELYKENSFVKAGIDIVVENVVGGGFTIEGADKKAVQLIEEFSKKVKLPTLMYRITRDILVFGNAFVEKVWNEEHKDMTLKIHDPRTIAIISDGRDEVLGYVKIENGIQIQRFAKDDIVHFKNLLGDRWYGRSQIEILLPKLRGKFKISEPPKIGLE